MHMQMRMGKCIEKEISTSFPFQLKTVEAFKNGRLVHKLNWCYRMLNWFFCDFHHAFVIFSDLIRILVKF